MPHIFISYAKKDTRKLALSLSDQLNKVENISAWVDRSLRAGQSWELQIQSEIDRCDVMVVLYSPDINRHKEGQEKSYMLTEIAYAQHTAKKRIIPVMAQETTPPMSLTMEHFIDYTMEGLVLDDLVEAICFELGVEANLSTSGGYDSDDDALELEDIQEQTHPPLNPTATREAVKNILFEPFEWCEISDGQFFYGTGDKQKILSLPTFYMAKYPITYSQFQIFIDDDEGFTDPRWWKGLAQDQSSEASEQNWKVANHPRERVSWYDAMAFCRWLSWRVGGGYDINNIADWAVRLPTEFEWEKAAGGTDKRLYPWGNRFDKTKANTGETHARKTTPVTKYDYGTSPYGVMDMSGNVWEWCLSVYSNPQQDPKLASIKSSAPRVLRGGSLLVNSFNVRVVSRDGLDPFLRDSDLGFRICAAPVSGG